MKESLLIDLLKQGLLVFWSGGSDEMMFSVQVISQISE